MLQEDYWLFTSAIKAAEEVAKVTGRRQSVRRITDPGVRRRWRVSDSSWTPHDEPPLRELDYAGLMPRVPGWGQQ